MDKCAYCKAEINTVKASDDVSMKNMHVHEKGYIEKCYTINPWWKRIFKGKKNYNFEAVYNGPILKSCEIKIAR